MSDTIIDLMRHGEPVGGRAYRGHTIDDPLSDKGWQQMRDAVGDNAPWTQIISSPLQRCREFAGELATKHQLPVTILDNLKEVGFGDWEGKHPDQINAENPDNYAAFYADPVNARPPGAEPLGDFIRRTIASFKQLTDQYSGEHLLIVCHAGVIRSIIAYIVHAEPLGMYKIKVDNAGISRILKDHTGFHLIKHNVSMNQL
jgi:probable phosphoglycerate mutase